MREPEGRVQSKGRNWSFFAGSENSAECVESSRFSVKLVESCIALLDQRHHRYNYVAAGFLGHENVLNHMTKEDRTWKRIGPALVQWRESIA